MTERTTFNFAWSLNEVLCEIIEGGVTESREIASRVTTHPKIKPWLTGDPAQGQQPCGAWQPSAEAIAAVIDPVAFDPISLADTHPSWEWRRETARATAAEILALADRGEFMKPTLTSSVSTEPKLGDIVTMNQESPYFSDWRGIEMKIVSLRLAPDGKLWASVIERPYDQGYRGYGTYDGETTDIDVAYLSALSSCSEVT